VFLSFCLSSPAFALHPLTADDACRVERGTFQLEEGMAFETLILFPAQSIGTAVYLFDNSWIFFHLHVELSNLEKNLDQSI
jgi:hypothetical protein